MQFPSIISVNIQNYIIGLIRLLMSRYISSFRLDYGFSTTDRLYDYVSARAYGEHEVSLIILYPANVSICDIIFTIIWKKVTLWKRSIYFFFLIGKLPLCLLPMPILGIQDDGWRNRFVLSRQQLCSIEEDTCGNCNINSSENINVIQLYSIVVESEISENSVSYNLSR